jgi:cytochrome c oxidase subunit 2
MALENENRTSSVVESGLTAALFAGLAIGGVWYGAGISMPELASRHGAGIDAMLNYLLLTVGTLFLVGYCALAWLIWQGARRRTITSRLSARRTELALSGVLGLSVALVAEGGVLAIGMPVWAEYFSSPPTADVLTLDITAQQFMWNVRYPGPDGVFGRTKPTLIDDSSNPVGVDRSDPASRDDLFFQNEITVPVNRPVKVRLHARDVIHSFFLPNFRVKQDAVPGMTPAVVFVPTRTGSYELLCAELCGLAHYRMRAAFTVVTPQEFDEWLRREQRTAAEERGQEK